MYRLTLLTAALLLFCPCLMFSQLPPGAARSAMSYADVALATDAFSLYSNPSLLTAVPVKNLSLHYCPSQFGLTELASYAAAGTFSAGDVHGAASASSFGFSLYRETEVGVAAAYEVLPALHAGAGLRYKRVAISTYGNSGVFALDLGFMYCISGAFSFGAAVQNLNRAKYAGSEEPQPTTARAGIGYSPASFLMAGLTIEKESNRKFRLLSGADFTIEDVLHLRFGYSTEPASFSAGAGIHYRSLQADYTIQEHANLGSTHIIGASINLNVLR